MSAHTQRRAAGFSLLEVMIVLMIMGIVTTQMFVVFNSQKRTYLASERALEVQEDARLIADLVAYDARHAGFMVPPEAAVSSIDGQIGGNDTPDRFCVSDVSYFSLPTFGEASDIFDARDAKFKGAAITSASVTGIVLPLGAVDIDGDNSMDFVLPAKADQSDGGGIIISNGARTHCARLRQFIPGDQLIFAPGHELDSAMASDINNFGGFIAVPAVVYEVDEPNLTLLRNGIALATQVEDMQIEYWLDNPIAGQVGQVDAGEFPVHDLNNPPIGLDTTMVRRVRVHVITRSSQADTGEQGQGTFNRHRRPATANRAEGPADNFKRKRFTASVMPRNGF